MDETMLCKDCQESIDGEGENGRCDDCAMNYCLDCGERSDDGEGYDGRCGNCADRRETAREE